MTLSEQQREDKVLRFTLMGKVATYLSNRARFAEAEPLYQQILTIRKKALGLHHPKTNTTRTAYTHLLRELGRMEEAIAIESQRSGATIEF